VSRIICYLLPLKLQPYINLDIYVQSTWPVNTFMQLCMRLDSNIELFVYLLCMVDSCWL